MEPAFQLKQCLDSAPQIFRTLQAPAAQANVPDQPQRLYEAKHVTTRLGLVEAGLGVAAVPSLAMPGKTLSPAAQQLYDLLVATRSVRPRKAASA
jgi:hypothetical protein